MSHTRTYVQDEVTMFPDESCQIAYTIFRCPECDVSTRHAVHRLCSGNRTEFFVSCGWPGCDYETPRFASAPEAIRFWKMARLLKQ